MALTRAQLRHQGLIAAYRAQEGKSPTRKEARRWLEPIRRAVQGMLQVQYFEYEGYILMPVPWAKDKSMGRLSEGVAGLLSFLSRLGFGPSPCLQQVSTWTPDSDFEQDVLLGGMAELNLIEDFILTQSRSKLVEMGKTEQIAILMEMKNVTT